MGNHGRCIYSAVKRLADNPRTPIVLIQGLFQ